MGTITDRLHQERGQILMLVVVLVTSMMGLIALVVDVGFWYSERRQIQNAADQATLAAAYEMKYGGSFADATAAALENADANGYNNDGLTNIVTVNIPPTEGNFAGSMTAIEVIVKDLDLETFFIQVLMPVTGHVEARGVAKLSGGGASGTPTEPFPVILPDIDCNADGAVVDGRVLEETEGYNNVANLISTSTSRDYGDAFYACDDQFLYFALRMNGPSTGGAVANENVYGGGCKDSKVEYEGSGDIKKVKGTIVSIGVSSFTVEAEGLIVTVDTDGNTEYKGNLNDFSDLTVGMAVEVKEETTYGPLYFLAKEVKDKNDVYCSDVVGDDYHEIYNTGWDTDDVKDHTFGKLLGSDRARFQISCDGQVRHDFIQDYLRQEGVNWASDVSGDGSVYVGAPTASASSLEFNLENPDITGWGDDPGENPLYESPPFDPQYPTYDSEYDGFVWEMIYEFKVPRQPLASCNQVTFGLNDFGGSTGGLEGMHSSPAKTDDGAFLQVEPFDVRLVE
ncbi:MAG: Tad domain-containing protein [Chloroflexi bacterium]|nr:Tad domain-containing protein [Chloroflexota bacterium]